MRPYRPTVLSLRQQVTDEFVPGYTSAGNASASAPSAPHWTGADSLFALWIGINDIGNSYSSGTAASATLNGRIMAVYAGLVDSLRGGGARATLS